MEAHRQNSKRTADSETRCEGFVPQPVDGEVDMVQEERISHNSGGEDADNPSNVGYGQQLETG